MELLQRAHHRGDHGKCAQRQHELQYAKKFFSPPQQAAVCEREEKRAGYGQKQGAHADAVAHYIAGHQKRCAQRERDQNWCGRAS